MATAPPDEPSAPLLSPAAISREEDPAAPSPVLRRTLPEESAEPDPLTNDTDPDASTPSPVEIETPPLVASPDPLESDTLPPTPLALLPASKETSPPTLSLEPTSTRTLPLRPSWPDAPVESSSDPDGPEDASPVEIEASPLLPAPDAEAMSTSPLRAPELAPLRSLASPPDEEADAPA
jgi:hypothetical protein